jgi:antitoxin CptB
MLTGVATALQKRARFMTHLTSVKPQNDHLDDRCQRLLFRCWHRGTQESDVILGSFAETSLIKLGSAQLDRFEALLDCSDPDLFDWILGGIAPPPEHDHDVMWLLRSSCAARRSQTHAKRTASTLRTGDQPAMNRPLSSFMFPTWYRRGYAVLIATVLLTALIWLYVLLA